MVTAVTSMCTAPTGVGPPSPRSSHEPHLPPHAAREVSAEFAGTMILILFGVGVVAQVVTSEGTLGDHDSIAWAWGSAWSWACTPQHGSAEPTSTPP